VRSHNWLIYSSSWRTTLCKSARGHTSGRVSLSKAGVSRLHVSPPSRPRFSEADGLLPALLRSLLAGPQLIFLAVFEHHGYSKEVRPRLTKLLRRRHFLVREMVADLDRKIGLKWLAWEAWILTSFQRLVEEALKFPLFSYRERPWMPPLCPGFGHQSIRV
jgi:hypothetical protein